MQLLGSGILFSLGQLDLLAPSAAPCALFTFPESWRLRVSHCCPMDTSCAVGRSVCGHLREEQQVGTEDKLERGILSLSTKVISVNVGNVGFSFARLRY